MTRRVITAAILLAPGSSLAATYTVAVDGSGDFTTISDAISTAKDGDRIEVQAGTYEESINYAGKGLQIVGVEGSGSTILDAGGAALAAVNFAASDTDEASLEGFTVLNAGARGVAIANASPALVDVVLQDLGSATATGGAVAIDGGSPTFTSCSFEDNTARDGAHVYVRGSATPTFTDTTFSGGSADNIGGAIYVDSGSVELVSSTLENNYSIYYGGAIALNLYTSLSLDDTTIYDNHSESAVGAGIYGAGGNTIDITSSELSSNYPYDYSSGYGGGALYMTSGTLNVSGSTFDANYAYYGAAMMLYGTAATFSDNTFSTNYAYYGGAIYLGSDTDLVDTGSVYDTNTSYYYGAAFYAYYIFSLSFSDVTFTENAAYYGYGGGIYAAYYGNIVLENTTFDNNYAYYYGGGVYAYYLTGDVSANGCTFTENEAVYGYGGAIYTYYLTNAVVSNSTFEYNEAYYSGGAIYTYYYGALTAINSDFYYNVATNVNGGAVYWAPLTTGYDLTFAGNTVVGNLSRYEGGGLYTSYGTSVLVQGNVFEGNQLEDDSFGGGLHSADYQDLVVWDNDFRGNQAVIGGGAYIGTGYDDSATAWLTNNLFVENAASRVAGGVALVEVGSAQFENNTLLGNQAVEDGGGLYVYDSISEIRNNLVAQTVDGAAITFDDAEALIQSSLTYNDLYDNAAGDQGGDLSTIVLDETNLFVDPELAGYSPDADFDNDSYVLARTSPCIDAGDPDLTDVDGTRSDIGMYGGPNMFADDADDDGFDESTDCDDGDATVYPGANDTWYDGVNSDCAYGSDYDQDGDGAEAMDYGGEDCQDTDASTTDCASVDTDDSGDTGQDPTDDTGEPDTDSASGDSGGVDDTPKTTDTGADKETGGCGCATGERSGGGAAGLLALVGVALARRRRAGR